ncbi:MAG: hypothetical protein H0U86_14410 [Chloroflexi bacterium]|nr:hypothetical protein [Chloroflexota bacterium]
MAALPVDTFELETAAGFRRLEFDPDILQFRDVRVLVDGQEAARMPFPVAESPRQEVALSVEGHELLAVAESRNHGTLVVYDLFHEQRSLKTGASLEQSRAAAPVTGPGRPAGHRIVEGIIQIAPAAGGSGMGVGVVAGVDRLGWPITLVLLLTGIGSLWLGATLARLTWRKVLRQRDWGERWQLVIGLVGVIAAFGVAFGAWIAVVAMLGPSTDRF